MSADQSSTVSQQLSIFNLTGHVALMTGASSGIGRHMAKTLARAGAHVIVAARRADKLDSLVSEIKQAGGQSHAVSLDVTRSESIRACFDEIETIAGVADIVISNAGTTVAKPAIEQTEADWDEVIDTNLKGCFMVDTEAARRMIKQKKLAASLTSPRYWEIVLQEQSHPTLPQKRV